jgi:hypothetical protein
MPRKRILWEESMEERVERKGRHGRIAEDMVWGMQEDATLERENKRNKERK